MDGKNVDLSWRGRRVTAADRNKQNGHKSCVLWFTGLSGSGKTTLAREVEKQLYLRQVRAFVLDGDGIRNGLNGNLGFSRQDRFENVRRIGEVARLFVDAGLITLVAAISPYRADRQWVRSRFRQGQFVEIYVRCPLEECERRDPKGLYKQARAGEIKHFTGISDPYEAPVNPELTIETSLVSVEEGANQILEYLRKHHYTK